MAGHREVLETWYRKVWMEEDADTIDAMLVADTKARGLGAQVHVGPPEFRIFHQNILKLVSDIDVQVDKSMEEGDWIAALFTFRATCRRSGKPVASTGTVFIKIIDGKLVDAYNHFDFMDFYEQLGLMPEDAFEKCLLGDGLT